MSRTIKSAASASVKDVDQSRRRVVAVASSFGEEDSDGDIIRRGAYADTIEERGPQGSNRIWFLDGHDPNRRVTKPDRLAETAQGLVFEATLPETRVASDLLALYQAGHLTEHSVMIDQIQRSKSDPRVIEQADLWEVSAVTWGANANTPVISVKAREALLLDRAASTNGISQNTRERLRGAHADCAEEVDAATSAARSPDEAVKELTERLDTLATFYKSVPAPGGRRGYAVDQAAKWAARDLGVSIRLRWVERCSKDEADCSTIGDARGFTDSRGRVRLRNVGTRKELVRTVLHEARHAWQHERYGASKNSASHEADARRYAREHLRAVLRKEEAQAKYDSLLPGRMKRYRR